MSTGRGEGWSEMSTEKGSSRVPSSVPQRRSAGTGMCPNGRDCLPSLLFLVIMEVMVLSPKYSGLPISVELGKESAYLRGC